MAWRSSGESLRKAAADIFRYGGSKSRKYERVHFF